MVVRLFHIMLPLCLAHYSLFWHNSSVLEVTYYAQNNASIMWKSLMVVVQYPQFSDRVLAVHVRSHP